MSFDSLLIHTCDIGGLTQVAPADAYGTPAETWPITYPSEPCRLMSTTGREVKVGAMMMISDWKMFIDYDVIVDEQDRVSNIKVRATGVVIDASTYEILLVQPRSDSTTLHHKELALRKVV